MPRVLLVDDDPDQLDIRRMILEQAGHQVHTAASALEAITTFRSHDADSVVMDLHLPRREDGCRLIRDLRAMSERVRIVVTTGWTADLPHLEENKLVNHVLQKPFKTELLLRLLALMVACLFPLAAVEFRVATPDEMVAALAFDRASLELAEVSLDGAYLAHVPVLPRVSVFLGRLAAGRHDITFSRPPRDVRIGPPRDDFTAHAPIVHARPEVGTRFTDVPLLAYCERLRDATGDYLQYTVIFSNEDGGTSTRALMARWGRTTDIEHVYRAWPGSGRTEIQTKDHKDVAFGGRYEQQHPLLYVVTENNMVGAEGEGTVRFRPAPVMADLSSASREKVMDDHLFTYEIAAIELEREGKLRPFGVVDGQKISDPRNYLYIEANVTNKDSRVAFRVRQDGGHTWRTSHLGDVRYAIERSGWARSTIELPPGTTQDQLGEFGVDCLVEPPSQGRPAPVAGECRLASVRLFLFDSSYNPRHVGKSKAMDTSEAIPTGEARTWKLR